MDSFNERVYKIVRQVPHGKVITYGGIARVLGEPRKAREVGWAMFQCPDDVPAHRVVNRLGQLSGRHAFEAADTQRRRLEAEGVVFGADGACDLDRFGWLPQASL